MSFRLKTILGVASIEILLLIILVWSSLSVLQSSHKASLQRQADVVISLFENATRDSLISHDIETLGLIGNDLLNSPSIAAIKIVDRTGEILFDRLKMGETRSTLTRLSPVVVGGQKYGELEISLSQSFVQEATKNAREKMIFVATVEVILVAMFSYILGTYLTRQLTILQDASKDIAAGKFGLRVPISGEDEIGKTAESFNRMSARLLELYNEISTSEKRLRTVLNTVGNGIITIDSNGIVLSVNPAVSDLFGYPKEELLGRNINILMPSPHAQKHDDYLKKFFFKDQSKILGKSRRVVGRAKNGKSIALELIVNTMEIEGDVLFVGTLRDLTQEEKALEEIATAESRLADAIESSGDGFVLYDQNDRLVICNQRYRDIYKASADLLIPGKTFREIIETGVARGQYSQAKGREREWIEERMDAHLNPTGPVEQKLEDGRWIRVWETKTDNGSIVGFRIDITELKEREEALRDSQKRFMATIDSALDCIICIDGSGHIVEFNPAAEKCFGYTRDEVIGKEMAGLIIPPSLRDAHRKGMEQYRKTGAGPVLGKRIEITAIRKNGEEFPIELAIEDASNNAKGTLFVSYLRDITEQKAYENALKESKEKAEVANQAKAGFLAMMSHEIRTPLNGVLGVLSLLSETHLSHEQNDYVKTAKESGEALLTIINDVLDFSKIEAGKLQFEESDVELQPLVASIKDLLLPQVNAKDINFQVNFAPNVPWSVICDAGRLRQILLNLTGNAVKFTQSGAVSLNVSASPTNANKNKFRFEIQDTGIGIPLERQDQIFEEFSTIDTSFTRKYGGTGLGLAITKRLVNSMGGRINFETTEGQGTTFWFEIEFETGAIPAGVYFEKEQTPPPQPVSHLRILVAEDHPTNMLITRKILENAGHTVYSASNGVEAVQMAQEYPIDVILMDGSMPEMDGMEATRRIRSLDLTCKNIPIIALTAHAMKGDRDKFIDAGMNDYLQKPVQKDKILNCIAQWANGTQTRPSDSPRLINTGNDQELLDVQYLIRLAEDTSPDMVPELIEIYLNDAHERLTRLKNAMVARDFETIELETHTLGSSAATYGLMKLHKLCRQAEATCLSDHKENVLPLCAELIEAAEKSWKYLKEVKLN